jgi:hypothetical protein
LEDLFLMSELGKFGPDAITPAAEPGKSDREGQKSSAATYGGQRLLNQMEDTIPGPDVSDKATWSSYKALSLGDLKLIVDARRDLEALDKMVSLTAQSDRQRLVTWRDRLDAFEFSRGDPDLDSLQKLIDNLRIKLQSLDKRIPLSEQDGRQALEEELHLVASMQNDLNDVWRQHLMDLVSTIGRKRAIEQFVATRTQTAISSLFGASGSGP